MSGSFRRLRALVVKESVQILRDPSSLLIAFALPAILLFLNGYGVSFDARTIRLGIALSDSGEAGRSLAAAFSASPYFQVRLERDRPTLEEALLTGELRGIVAIPADFSRQMAAGGRAPVQIIADGSETNTAAYVQNYSQGVVANWWGQRGGGRPAGGANVELVSGFRHNPELTSRNSLLPGALAVIMAVIGTLLTALVVAREWERGTMEALMATPVTIAELVAGKLIPYFILGLLTMLVCTGLCVTLFGVPFRGSLPALILSSGAFLLAALGQGLLISSAAKNQFIAALVAMITGFLPAYLLSGFIFEIASMPLPVRIITRIIPARYLVSNLQTLFLAGDVWPLLLPNILILLTIAAVLFLLTARKTVKRLR